MKLLLKSGIILRALRKAVRQKVQGGHAAQKRSASGTSTHR